MTDYRKMPVHAKIKHVLGRWRATPIRCERCNTQLTEADMPAHLALRCAGSRAQRDAVVLADASTQERDSSSSALVDVAVPSCNSGQASASGVVVRK